MKKPALRPERLVSSSAPSERGPSTSTGRNPTPWQPRFGIRELLMLMLICSVLAAALGYLYQDQKAGGRSLRFIFLTVAGPSLMAVTLGLIFVSIEFFRRRKRKKPSSKAEDVF
jgi:hypothetical protein